MQTTAALLPLRPAPRAPRLRRRAELPALAAPAPALAPCSAAHDFLVPNPRPDLTLDPQTLRMLEAR